MTTVEQVRKALEELRSTRARLMWDVPEDNYSIPCAMTDALVAEGLKVCEVLESLQPDEAIECF